MANLILGGILLLGGVLIIISFPYISDYQPEEMSKAGIVLGLILVAIGLFLLKS